MQPFKWNIKVLIESENCMQTKLIAKDGRYNTIVRFLITVSKTRMKQIPEIDV